MICIKEVNWISRPPDFALDKDIYTHYAYDHEALEVFKGQWTTVFDGWVDGRLDGRIYVLPELKISGTKSFKEGIL